MNKIRNIQTIVIAAALGSSFPAQSQDDDWQLKRLISPSKQQILSERNRVFIYDGLRSSQIDKALDDHFERIHGMMFVREISDKDGNEEILDDGCDD